MMCAIIQRRQTRDGWLVCVELGLFDEDRAGLVEAALRDRLADMIPLLCEPPVPMHPPDTLGVNVSDTIQTTDKAG